nr:hypothetical protein Clen_414 [Cedratvirus lena]WIL04582.1 hypothetical protein Cduv_102 [Cedratvirus duvanny]
MEEYLLCTEKIMLLQNILAGYETEKRFPLFSEECFAPLKQNRRTLLFRRVGESPLVTNARKLKMLWTTEGEVPCLDEGYEFVEIKLERGLLCNVQHMEEDTFFFTAQKIL